MRNVRVVCALIEKDGRVLIARRAYGKQKGYWEFPGGKIEENETPEAAIVREIREEMELEINVRELLGTVEHDYEDFHLSMDCFLCTLVSSEMHLHDHSGIRWISAYDEDSGLLGADQKVLKMYLAHVAKENALQYNQNREEIRMNVTEKLKPFLNKQVVLDLTYFDCECSYVLEWKGSYTEDRRPSKGEGVLYIDCRPFNEYSLITYIELATDEENKIASITPGAHLYQDEVNKIDFEKVWQDSDLSSALEFLEAVTTLDE